MLTGKAKEDFEKWYDSNKANESAGSVTINSFYGQLPPSMQYGVYVDFFDSVGIMIELRIEVTTLFYFSIDIYTDVSYDSFCSDNFKTRAEARKKAVEKANEIYNKQKP
jgi:hypothetical protein